MILSFTVIGVPQSKGSTQSFGYLAKDPATGQPRTRTTKSGKVVPVIRTATKGDNPKTSDWQKMIAQSAMVAIANMRIIGLPRPQFQRIEKDAVSLEVTFYMPRPKYLKDRVDVRHTTRPDFDKLVRAVADGLKGVAWGDDCQVDYSVIRKRYAEPGGQPRAEIAVYRSEDV